MEIVGTVSANKYVHYSHEGLFVVLYAAIAWEIHWSNSKNGSIII